MDASYHNTPPKNAERIRATLESVHRGAGKRIEPGPHRDGLAPDATLVIASFRDHECCRRYQEMLLRAGIMSRAQVHRTYSEIVVDYSDKDKDSGAARPRGGRSGTQAPRGVSCFA